MFPNDLNFSLILNLFKHFFLTFCVFTPDPYDEAPQQTVSSCFALHTSVAYLSEILKTLCKRIQTLSVCRCLQNEEKSKTGRFGK